MIMSVYFTLLFCLLIFEMSFIFILVLPLPFRIRKSVVAVYDRAIVNTQSKTAIGILIFLVTLLFVESQKRANTNVLLPHHPAAESNPNGITSTESLATRAYNQRNMYISGFILYFSICIPTIMSIVRKLVKYEIQIRAKNEKVGSDCEEYNDLKKLLKEKEASLMALKTQMSNLEKSFDAKVEQTQASNKKEE